MPYLAPAGTPVTMRDIACGIVAMFSEGSPSIAVALRQATGLPHVWPMSSGRAAMTIILKVMHVAARNHSRDEVIIPAYTCYSVPAAIECAGLKPRLCDVDPATLGMDPEALDRQDFTRTLAVISANLYGLPNDLTAIQDICGSRGVYLVDDAAQALGASVNGQAVGSFGDAGFYSFDKGKIISTMQGGAVVARPSELARGLDAAISRLRGSAFLATATIMLNLLVYSLFLRPSMYGLVRRLPFTGLGHTRYETRFPITNLSGFQIGVAANLLPRVGELNAGRCRNADAYTAALHGMTGIAIPKPIPGARAVFARYPVRLRNAAIRHRVLQSLNHAGIGATASYPLSLADVPEVMARIPAADRNCPGAREISATIVTLPTHAYCPPNLPATVRTILNSCLE